MSIKPQAFAPSYTRLHLAHGPTICYNMVIERVQRDSGASHCDKKGLLSGEVVHTAAQDRPKEEEKKP